MKKEKVPEKCEECGRSRKVIRRYVGREIAVILKKIGPGYPWLCQYCRAKWNRG